MQKSEEFPKTTLWTGDDIGHRLQRENTSKALTNLDEADPSDWIIDSEGQTVFSQTLFQADGYAVTLLVLGDEESDPDDEPKWR